MLWKTLPRKGTTGTNMLQSWNCVFCITSPYFYLLQIVHLPELKNIHSKPVTTSNITSEHNYAKNLVHPLTLTMGRYVVGDRFHDGPTSSSHKRETCKYHNMRLCPELTQFQSVTSEVINSKIKSTRLQSSSQQNIYHYYFYNRLMDHWHNLKVVNKQLTCMKGGMKPGETIARDELHRFVYVCALCKKQGHDSTSCFNYWVFVHLTLWHCIYEVTKPESTCLSYHPWGCMCNWKSIQRQACVIWWGYSMQTEQPTLVHSTAASPNSVILLHQLAVKLAAASYLPLSSENQWLTYLPNLNPNLNPNLYPNLKLFPIFLTN